MKPVAKSNAATAPFECKVSRVRPHQIAATAGLLVNQLREHNVDASKTDVARGLNRILRRKSLGFALVATGPRNKIVGVALGTGFLGLEHGGPSGWLEEFYVIPEYRNCGIGARLLEEFIHTARKFGWRAIDLEVDVNHRRVMSLYRRNGFSTLPRRRMTYSLNHQS